LPLQEIVARVDERLRFNRSGQPKQTAMVA